MEVDMAQNQVTVKGIVDPQGICDRLRKRTMRNAVVISPPPPPPPAEGDAAGKEDPPPPPPVVHSQVSEVKTVELLVNMHCEACVEQLQKKILKMRGKCSAAVSVTVYAMTSPCYPCLIKFTSHSCEQVFRAPMPTPAPAS